MKISLSLLFIAALTPLAAQALSAGVCQQAVIHAAETAYIQYASAGGMICYGDGSVTGGDAQSGFRVTVENRNNGDDCSDLDYVVPVTINGQSCTAGKPVQDGAETGG